MTAEPALEARQNNFDALRFLAASLVILSHSFALNGSTFEPLAWATDGFETLGGLGVATFFVMSGFLIAKSWDHDPRPAPFFGKRLLRIGPALAAAILLAVFVLGPLASSLAAKRYFAEPATWDYLWGLSVFRMRYYLPGVFEANPVPGAVNGSLWTIPVEVGCYVVAGALGWLRLFPRRLIALLALVLLLVVDWRPLGIDLGPMSGVWARSYARYASYFFAGALLYSLPRSIVRSPALAALLALVLLSGVRSSLAAPLAHLTIPVLVLFAAGAPLPALHGFGRYGDFSYGMYAYAFPIQQWLVDVAPFARSPGGLFALSFPVTVVVAAISWHLLEAPALRWKARIPPSRPSLVGG